jgi:glycosyltransferase involved in cell wall biosynthesis
MTVFIHTIAYNAEKTIDRCIESIVNQTYTGDKVWDILDNGSTDNTYEIIKAYTAAHPWIHLHHIDENRNPRTPEEIETWQTYGLPSEFKIREKISDSDLFCNLDSDDAYKPTFLHDAIKFLEENDLDIAAVGSDFLDVQTGEIFKVRSLKKNMILETREQFSNLFPIYYGFARTVWGKIYKIRSLQGYKYTENLFFGADTDFALQAFASAKHVGVLAGVHHDYYISKSSVSFQWNDKRIGDEQLIYQILVNYLNVKCGEVSPYNDCFVRFIYFNLLIDETKILLASETPDTVKLDVLYDMYICDLTREFIISLEVYEKAFPTLKWEKQVSDLFNTVLIYLCSEKITNNFYTAIGVFTEIVPKYAELGKYVSTVVGDDEALFSFNLIDIKYLINQKKYFKAAGRIEKLLKSSPGNKVLLDLQKQIPAEFQIV